MHDEVRPVYAVTCRFHAGWWVLHVAGARSITARVRFLEEAESQARHAIALVMDLPEDAFDITLDVVRPPVVH